MGVKYASAVADMPRDSILIIGNVRQERVMLEKPISSAIFCIANSWSARLSVGYCYKIEEERLTLEGI